MAQGAKTRVNDLIASLQGVSDSINAEKSSGAAVPASLRRLRLQAPGRRTPTLSRRTPRRARST